MKSAETKDLSGKIVWHTEKRKLSELKPSAYNPRKASEKDTAELTKSLDRFSLADPIIINRDNTIIGGHFRYRILKEKHGLNGYEVDVRVPAQQLNEKQERELNLRLNRNQGEWDFKALADLGQDLLKDVGFSDSELDETFHLDFVDDFDLESEKEKLLKSGGIRTALGQIYKLGDHKLIIGDATDRTVWQSIFGSERFEFMFTDPPYRLAYSKQKTRKVRVGGGQV